MLVCIVCCILRYTGIYKIYTTALACIHKTKTKSLPSTSTCVLMLMMLILLLLLYRIFWFSPKCYNKRIEKENRENTVFLFLSCCDTVVVFTIVVVGVGVIIVIVVVVGGWCYCCWLLFRLCYVVLEKLLAWSVVYNATRIVLDVPQWARVNRQNKK